MSTLFGKPKNQVVKRPGAFSKKAKQAGKSVSAFARQVLKKGSKASTRTKKEAVLYRTFKKMARKRKGK